jgi:DNA-binding sugar fermentation-stimulating protein
MCFSITLGVEHHVSDAAPITEIDKDETTVIPTTLNPTHKGNPTARIISTEGATVVSAFPVTKRIQSHVLPSKELSELSKYSCGT